MMDDFRNMTSTSRGVRNNNPGNLRPSGDAWRGMVGQEDNFLVFETVQMGLRAMFIDLHTKISKRGLKTIRQILKVYAPTSENDTESYIRFVSRTTGIASNACLNTHSDTLKAIGRAIVNYENGTEAKYITDTMIAEGLQLAARAREMVPNAASGKCGPVPSDGGNGGMILAGIGVAAAIGYYYYRERKKEKQKA